MLETTTEPPLLTSDSAQPREGVILRALLAAVALLAVIVPLLLVTLAPPLPIAAVARKLPHQHVVPAAELPPVEPVKLIDLSPDDARAYNAAIPFATGPNPSARPFHLTGAEDDQQRAIACLAAAELYEAGDDAQGDRAVAQVVLNRVRHPAFPKTVCGVVFEGSDRSTGCQFTFTCDGSLDRWKPTAAAWARATDIASKALNGAVDKAVGYSTHYHTDWVVPYWSASLDKIARVGTQLFYRWTGWWGTPPAFNRHADDSEPVIALLAPISPAHATLEDAVGPLDAAAIANGGLPSPIASDPDTFLVTLDPKWPADSFAALANQTCGARPYCKFMAWTDKAHTPAALPLTPQEIAAMAFSYLRDQAHGYDKALWNCATVKRNDKTQCMKKQVFLPTMADVPDGSAETNPVKILVPPAIPARPEPDGLNGVHRRAATPTPKPIVIPPSLGKD